MFGLWNNKNDNTNIQINAATNTNNNNSNNNNNNDDDGIASFHFDEALKTYHFHTLMLTNSVVTHLIFKVMFVQWSPCQRHN